MSKQVSLWVNDECIPIDCFVSGFIDHTVGGIVADPCANLRTNMS